MSIVSVRSIVSSTPTSSLNEVCLPVASCANGALCYLLHHTTCAHVLTRICKSEAPAVHGTPAFPRQAASSPQRLVQQLWVEEVKQGCVGHESTSQELGR